MGRVDRWKSSRSPTTSVRQQTVEISDLGCNPIFLSSPPADQLLNTLFYHDAPLNITSQPNYMDNDSLMDEAPLPPPPRRNGLGSIQRRRRFVDATDDFWSACSQLALGQMVHPPTFTLLDTMACIAIGDPRMDSGIHPLPSDLVPAADRRDDASSSSTDFNPHDLLTAQDVAWIMDRLVACEVRKASLYASVLAPAAADQLLPRRPPSTNQLPSPRRCTPASTFMI